MTFTGTVLALDLAITTGWAWGEPGGAPDTGHYRIGKPGASRAHVYREFRNWLDLLLRTRHTDLIVYESPALPMFMQGKTNISTIKMLIGLGEQLEEWAYEKIELREASVAQVRAHFIGSNMKASLAKPLTMERCKQLGWSVETSDEADAAALWDYQVACLRPDVAVHSTPLFKLAKNQKPREVSDPRHRAKVVSEGD